MQRWSPRISKSSAYHAMPGAVASRANRGRGELVPSLRFSLLLLPQASVVRPPLPHARTGKMWMKAIHRSRGHPQYFMHRRAFCGGCHSCRAVPPPRSTFAVRLGGSRVFRGSVRPATRLSPKNRYAQRCGVWDHRCHGWDARARGLAPDSATSPPMAIGSAASP